MTDLVGVSLVSNGWKELSPLSHGTLFEKKNVCLQNT